MDIENKTLEILDLVREKVLNPDEALPHILRLFSVRSSVCLHRFYHVKNNGYVYCTDCNKKLGSQTDC